MASAPQIRDLITETTTGTVRPCVPREVRRYAARRREKGEPWAVIARETGLRNPGTATLARSQVTEILREIGG